MTAIVPLLVSFLQIYSFVLLARALVSWIPNLDPSNPIVQLIYQLTEPVLDPIRRLIPPLGGTFDISILVAYFGLTFLSMMLERMI
jgi:YggT family protein